MVGVIENLELALEGRSLAARAKSVANRLGTLYVPATAVAGAIAVLFAPSLASSRTRRAIAD
jgi:hypothetical protein